MHLHTMGEITDLVFIKTIIDIRAPPNKLEYHGRALETEYSQKNECLLFYVKKMHSPSHPTTHNTEKKKNIFYLYEEAIRPFSPVCDFLRQNYLFADQFVLCDLLISFFSFLFFSFFFVFLFPFSIHAVFFNSFSFPLLFWLFTARLGGISLLWNIAAAP
uniref:Uncharacterized protein n=1 Tax=Trypanosoma vivax (strain Y486) TaxID=1055687 RepID=G0TX15_TRYVY|nr:hypothetical protein TVY486_0602950 [Trypanosoma vivax Y486]